MKYTIELDDYEVANLRAAIEAAGYWGGQPAKRNPLYALNTGDWLGQIFWKLPQVDCKPNKTPEYLAKAAWEIAGEVIAKGEIH